tara:strand:+ start:1045 stop:2400 length:1356 start_codon:yes stop_codon:yes gene_type:complete
MVEENIKRPKIIIPILITIAFLIIYKAGSYISLIPYAPTKIFPPYLANNLRFDLFALGIGPAILGFTITECIFMIIPPLDKVRRAGTNGRKTMTIVAVIVSLIIACFNAKQILGGLAYATFQGEQTKIIKDPYFLNYSINFLFFIAGFLLLIYLCKIVSAKGIGNGFCLIFSYDILFTGYTNTSSILNSYMIANTTGVKVLLGICYIIAGFLIVRYLLKKVHIIGITDNKNNTTDFALPFFIQGLPVLTTTLILLYLPEQFPTTLSENSGLGNLLRDYQSHIYIFLMIIISPIGYLIFCNKKRILNNLPKKIVSVNNKELTKKIIIISYITLIILPLPIITGHIPAIIPTVELIIFTAIFIDLISEFRFKKSHVFKEIIDLDNVHLATYLKENLHEQNIEFYIQGYHYRKLFFFLQPLVKMKLLVKKEDRDSINNLISSFVGEDSKENFLV